MYMNTNVCDKDGKIHIIFFITYRSFVILDDDDNQKWPLIYLESKFIIL